MSGQTIYLVLETVSCEVIFASADEIARDRALCHLRAALPGRGFADDVIGLDDDGAMRALLEEVAEG